MAGPAGATGPAGPAGATGAAGTPASPNTAAFAPYTHAPNPVLWQFGDSRVSINMNYSTGVTPASIAKMPTSPVTWALRFLGDRVGVDLSKGYGGTAGVAFKVNVVPNNLAAPLAAGNGSGTGYSASSTCSSTGGGTYGSPTVDGNGSVLSVPLLTGGSSLTAAPVVTCTGGTGLNAVAVVGGSGTFGDVGETSCQAYARMADLEAVAQPGDMVLVRLGTNDELSGLTLAQSEACMQLTFNRMQADGYYVLYQMDGPRLPWGAASDGTAPAPQYRKQLYARRAWVRRYALQDATKNANLYPHLIVYDTFPETSDTTSAYGDPKTGYTADGLHDSQLSAYIGGWKLAQVIAGLLPGAPGVLGTTSQAETYDATYNPGGPLNPNPALTGTTGTALASSGGLTASGTTPTGYTLAASGTTGTQTVTTSFETPRTDALNGQRFQVVTSCGGSGSATQTYSLATQSYVQLAAAGLTNGTKIRLDVDVEVSGQTGMVLAPSVLFNINDTSSVLFYDFDGASSASGQVAIENSGVYDGLVPPLAAGTTLHLSTPALTLTNIGTTAGTQVQVKGTLVWGLNCSASGTGTAGATVKVTRFSLHPVL